MEIKVFTSLDIIRGASRATEESPAILHCDHCGGPTAHTFSEKELGRVGAGVKASAILHFVCPCGAKRVYGVTTPR